MKKIFALLAVASALSMVSCNRSKLDPEEGGASATSDEDIFWSVVGKLVSIDDITPDYKGKTFQPMIGSPQDGDPSVRIVSVNDPGAAVARFNALTGAEITTSTQTYTYQSKQVGSLTWNLSQDNTAWATVDVNVPAVPSLRKIIYRSPEQGDTNGSVGNNGSAYYRFGDVIKKTRAEDGITEYWVCVRPAFGPEKKGDSHWICVSPLPERNIWPYNSTSSSQAHRPWKASNDLLYGLPDKIRDEVEWHQDLAEMLFAILYPELWSINVTNYYHKSDYAIFSVIDGLRMFNDFDVANIRYHNAEFWKNVQRQWKEKDLVQKVFGVSYADMEAALNPNMAGASGLHLLYYGKDWSTISSNSPKLFQVHYAHGTEVTEKNLHKQTKSKPTAQVVTPNKKDGQTATNFPFDVKTETSQVHPFVVKPQFFGDNHPRWIVRYATGDELSTTKTSNNQLPIPGFNADQEVYRYYRDVNPEHSLLDAPEVTEAADKIVNDKAQQDFSPYMDDGHYAFGDVLRDGQGNRWFVIRPSGGSEESNPDSEQSPFAELVSFEGITFSADEKVATNIPDKNRLLRVAMPLWYLYQEAFKHPDGYVEYAATNIRERGNVELLHLMQTVSIQRYNGTVPSVADVCSFAYYVPGSEKQHLIRYILETQDPGNAFVTVMYDHYPTDATAGNVYPGIKSTDFSNNFIYLQDVADAEKVAQYGNDYMASRRLSTPNGQEGQERAYRTQVEPRAEKASNYRYNKQTWASAETKPLGMWNEPVLFLRATALYDRGKVYATRTVDGVDLTLEARAGVNPDWQEQNPHAWFSSAQAYDKWEYRFIDGSHATIPYWQSVWAQ